MIKSGLRSKNRQMQRTNQKLEFSHVTAYSCSVICSTKRKEDEYCIGVVFVYST